jgi:hypothetical protein
MTREGETAAYRFDRIQRSIGGKHAQLRGLCRDGRMLEIDDWIWVHEGLHMALMRGWQTRFIQRFPCDCSRC